MWILEGMRIRSDNSMTADFDVLQEWSEADLVDDLDNLLEKLVHRLRSEVRGAVV